jgi:hypothetical protein
MHNLKAKNVKKEKQNKPPKTTKKHNNDMEQKPTKP